MIVLIFCFLNCVLDIYFILIMSTYKWVGGWNINFYPNPNAVNCVDFFWAELQVRSVSYVTVEYNDIIIIRTFKCVYLFEGQWDRDFLYADSFTMCPHTSKLRLKPGSQNWIQVSYLGIRDSWVFEPSPLSAYTSLVN